MNISTADTVHAVVTSLVVAALVACGRCGWARCCPRPGVLASALLHTPVGLNATRLVVMFALAPVLAAAACPRPDLRSAPRHPAGLPGPRRGRARRAAGCGLLVATAGVVTADLRSAGDPTADRRTSAPLRAGWPGAGSPGGWRLPPTRNYWEAAPHG
ncbi:hypothetical protein [Micromonospora sp. C28ISP2-4]|uniref:hypothetical protein n=1 Tax=Micromonospora sp. C28ISP2-4 TaxID=3059523 RepID=UPI002677255F|nr:hypothetical protein [Micromonospora sp. C28ISP2-4]MDO3686904.1 hypothetical protein [Micromonospora sp. C28ISP2-4]